MSPFDVQYTHITLRRDIIDQAARNTRTQLLFERLLILCAADEMDIPVLLYRCGMWTCSTTAVQSAGDNTRL